MTKKEGLKFVSDETFGDVVNILSELGTYDYQTLTRYIEDREAELHVLKVIQGEIGG